MMRTWLAILAFLLLAVPASAEHIPVDVLLQRVFTDEYRDPYESTSDFDGTAVVTWRGGRVTARALGNLREWRTTRGGPRRREVTITTLEVPLILRPFSGGLKNLIKERIEREEGSLTLLQEYDLFVVEEMPGNRYLIGGVRADIVSEVLVRYGRAGESTDVAVRREVARWLFEPRQRDLITRGGGPYMVLLLADDHGRYYRLLLQYDWGPVETQIDWGLASGRMVWREVKMDTSSEIRGLGPVGGKLNLRFSNFCFNCRR